MHYFRYRHYNFTEIFVQDNKEFMISIHLSYLVHENIVVVYVWGIMYYNQDFLLLEDNIQISRVWSSSIRKYTCYELIALILFGMILLHKISFGIITKIIPHILGRDPIHVTPKSVISTITRIFWIYLF